ncbi:unnamed protein product [Acanthoscelides obtectus]|uniref:Uncharacterized protein n=1 Tax=Acanthoscelides obtectus TaxID=200917 RepID=A0A9P0ML02_ACAOB|nr:unnamed protein product [Acanthoscelides obtectus]CAK1684578.1 hypothetical protein AOBTE_LOCUS34943 [Acanthoscelides obtectus]
MFKCVHISKFHLVKPNMTMMEIFDMNKVLCLLVIARSFHTVFGNLEKKIHGPGTKSSDK